MFPSMFPLSVLCVFFLSFLSLSLFPLSSPSASPSHSSDRFSKFSHSDWTALEDKQNIKKQHAHCVTIFLKHSIEYSQFIEESLINASSPIHISYGTQWSHHDIQRVFHEKHPKAKDSAQKIMEFIELRSTSPPHPHRSLRLLPNGEAVFYCDSIESLEKTFNTKINRHRPNKLHKVIQHFNEFSEPFGVSFSDDKISLWRSVESVTLPSEFSAEIAMIGGLNTPIHRHHKLKYNREIALFQHNLKQKSPLIHDKIQGHSLFSWSSHPKAKAMNFNEKSDESTAPSPASLACSQPVTSITNPEIKMIPPLILNYTGGDKEFSIYWTVWCQDGQLNRDKYPLLPCSTIEENTGKIIENQNIHKFSIQLTDVFNHHLLIPIVPDVCQSPDGVCTATIPIKNYEGYHIVVIQHMQDGQAVRSCPSTSLVFASDFATPDFLRELYQIPVGLRSTHPDNSQAVVEFEAQYFDPSDVTLFLDFMGQKRVHTSQIIGPNDPTEGRLIGGESSLDIQVMLAVAPHAYTVFWTVVGHENGNTEEPFLRWIREANEMSDADLPRVQSISYGDIEESLPTWYTERLNIEFAKMGLRGVTIVVASGDQGVSSDWSGTDIEGDYAAICQKTHPEFPTSSPWILAVGGTQLSDRHRELCWSAWRGVHIGCSDAKEITCSAEQGGIITSGGGTSNRFTAPSYQHSVLEYYFKKSGAVFPSPSKWNRTGRAYPDISLYASKYPIIMSGNVVPTAGTSASTPLAASFVTLWNDIRLHYNKTSLGFINPLLYHIYSISPESFHDVVYGSNNCLLRNEECCKEGFHAVAGYDLTSGLGSLNWMLIGKYIEEEIIRKKGKGGKWETQTLVERDDIKIESSMGSLNNMKNSFDSLHHDIRVLQYVNTVMGIVIVCGIVYLLKDKHKKNRKDMGIGRDEERLPLRGYGYGSY